MMKVAPLALLLGSAHANTVKNMNGMLHLRYRTAEGRGGKGREGGERERECLLDILPNFHQVTDASAASLSSM